MRRLRDVTAVLGLAAALAVPAWAADAPAQGAETGQSVATAGGLELESTIVSLAERGVATKTPGLLLAAAQIRLTLMRSGQARGVEREAAPPAAPAAPAAPSAGAQRTKPELAYDARSLILRAADLAVEIGSPADMEAAAVLAENTQLGLGDAQLAADLRNRLQALQKGRIPGPGTVSDYLGPDEYVTYRIPFYGGELAEIEVIAEGGGDADLYVFDSAGNLVIVDDDSSNYCYVSWHPRRDAVYIVKVANYSSRRGVAFTLNTN